jgi:predicted metal-dependent hydrolase
VFKARVMEWARKLEVDAHSIYIRPMTRKWASYATAGTLSFNDELLRTHYPTSFLSKR